MKPHDNRSQVLTVGVSKTSRITISVAIVITIMLLILSQQSYGHQGATGVVKKRMDIMSGIGKNSKKLKALVMSHGSMMSGSDNNNGDEIAEVARSIVEASRHVKMSFKERSLDEPSEALPEIWEEWEKFEAAADKMTEQAELLSTIAPDADKRKIMQQFASLGKTCRSCHTDFRMKKD